ncbi:MAG: hypothetical protein ABSD70_03080 [Terracidiphilus sp.]|jgi:hypothetical protein
MLALMGLRYTLLLLIIPAYGIALKRRQWTMLPLWLVSTAAMLTQFALGAQQSTTLGGLTHTSALVYVGEMVKIMIVPIAVQFAAVLKGWQQREANRPGSRPRLLVALDGEL